MSELIAKLDDLGQAAWIAVMVLAFVFFWPAGLAILAYLIWSGRMGCGRNSSWGGGFGSRFERKMQRFQDKMDRWGVNSNAGPSAADRSRSYAAGFTPSGNRAFDDYRETTMKRLEEEFGEFKSFLDRLREAKDKQEFEQFMSDRRNRPSGGTSIDVGGGGNSPPAPSSSSQFRS